ncbi:hypothetical protein [Nonomuraea salmonea]|uniref:hypothetical protein n=1 Tax=Nonomuraea salmonea TaxID=46181 RepID=UPI002FE99AE0
MTPDLEPHLANCRDYWLGWGAAARSGGALAYYRSDIAHSQLNGVLRAQDPGRVRQAAEAMGDVPWLWWVGPDSAGGIADELVRHGAELAGGRCRSWPSTLTDSPPSSSPPAWRSRPWTRWRSG